MLAFSPRSVDQLVAAVLALLSRAGLGQLEDVRLRHHVGIEGAGAEADVDHAGLHRLADSKVGIAFGPPMKLICSTPLPSLFTSPIQSTVRFT